MVFIWSKTSLFFLTILVLAFILSIIPEVTEILSSSQARTMLRKAVAAVRQSLPTRMLGCVSSCPSRGLSTDSNEKRRKKVPMQPVLSTSSAAQKQVIRQVPATSTKLRLRVYAPTLSNPWAYALSPPRVDENTWYFDDDASSSIVGASEIRQSKKGRGADNHTSAGGDSGVPVPSGPSTVDAGSATTEIASRDMSCTFQSLPLAKPLPCARMKLPLLSTLFSSSLLCCHHSALRIDVACRSLR
jgi:hypothetical protein